MSGVGKRAHHREQALGAADRHNIAVTQRADGRQSPVEGQNISLACRAIICNAVRLRVRQPGGVPRFRMGADEVKGTSEPMRLRGT